MGRTEHTHVGAGLGQDGGRRHGIDAGHDLENLKRLAVGLQTLQHLLLDGLDAQIELALGLHEVAQQHALPVAEREAQGVVERLDLLGDMTHQPLEDHLARGTRDEALEDGPAIGAEDIGKDAADPHPGTINHLLDAVAGPAAFLDQAAPIAAETPGLHITARPTPAQQGILDLVGVRL